MSYKIITYTVEKEKIHDNTLISKKFFFVKEITSVIIGTVSNTKGEVIE